METAVITTGGLGTRLLTATKVNPKTMLPLYVKSTDNNPNPFLQPLIEIIFSNDMKISINMNNALNKEYEMAQGYKTLGRVVTLGANFLSGV